MEFPLSTPQQLSDAVNDDDMMLLMGRNDDIKYGTVMISSFPDCVFLPESEEFTSNTSSNESTTINMSSSFCDDDDDEGINNDIPSLFLKPRTTCNTSLSPSLDFNGVPQLSTTPSDLLKTPQGRENSQVHELCMLRRCVAFSEDSTEVVMEEEEDEDDESLALSDDEESIRDGEVVVTSLYWEDSLGRSNVGDLMNFEETSVTSREEDDEESLSGLRFFKQQGRRGQNDALLPPLIPKMDHDDGFYHNRNKSSPFVQLPNATAFTARGRGGIFRRRNQQDEEANNHRSSPEHQNNDDACLLAPLKKHSSHIMFDRNEFYQPVSSPLRPNLCIARMA